MARDYAEYAWHFRVLADAHREGRLVFVLGAGVSKGYGLPDWEDLLVNLLLGSQKLPRLVKAGESAEERKQAEKNERTALKQILNRVARDPLLQAAVVRAAYPRGQWWAAVKSQLEARHAEGKQDLVPPANDPRPALQPIARLLVNAIRRNPHRHVSVLTFNYDSLLDDEVARELKGRKLNGSLLQSVSDGRHFERTWVDAGIYIYHLHGYLAPYTNKHSGTDAILDADSYVSVLRGDHWSWRCMERALTASGAASLFIGLSIADPSLRYLLTRWGEWQTPITGVYLASPPEQPLRPRHEGADQTLTDRLSTADRRTLALMDRAVMDLYAAVLDRLHLVCYHLSSFDEIPDIVEGLEAPMEPTP